MALYVQGTVKDTASFDRTNNMMIEYSGFTLGLVASKVVRTIMMYVGTLGEKP